ncbi:hypothetical protein AL072_32895 [Azospirillum thiophilum]|uniref:Uncharacterized protein n=1 Tax=Azospirillum thiophilum TaxID=528244 RepID=A0AAC8W603_9PROT|nr:hypothetical protein [Azospirillum thiophilum]ALG75736.1 hypothetical protein AL072_32895 [Azospirillum thiophilum]
MSRTFRRRRDVIQRQREIDWYFQPWEHGEDEPNWKRYVEKGWRIGGRRFRRDATAIDESLVVLHLIAYFHRESRPGERSAPAHFRRTYNARNRYADRSAIHRALACGDDNIVLPVRCRSVNWDWF